MTTTTPTIATLAALEQLIRADADLRAQVRDSATIARGLAADILQRDAAAQLRRLAIEAEAPPAQVLRTTSPAGDPLAALLARAAIDPATRDELLDRGQSQQHAERLLASSAELRHEFHENAAMLAAFLRAEARAGREPATSSASVRAFASSRQVWALEARTHQLLAQALRHRADGGSAPSAALGRASSAAPMRVQNGTAIIPIRGVIAHHASMLDDWFGGTTTSVDSIRANLRAALADKDVRSIVLEVDSPGGSVSGIDELAAEIRAARDQKPIVAHTDAMMASASYWLAAQASKVVATRSAQVGSIGVVASLLDDHRRLQGLGLDPVVLKSVPAKGGLQSNGTFSDADRADVQREVDAYHSLFVDAVAAGRRITRERAQQLADGRLYLGAEAQQRGLVDAVQPLAAVT